MYCGACTRDINLLKGLIDRGHDVETVALYTPLHADYDPNLKPASLFFGGINVYLQQVSRLFRHTPAAFDRLLDNPALLGWVSKFAITTRAEDLGPMTVSVLAGRDGRQRKELDRLISYLEGAERPDIVNITNSMLSAIAPEIKKRLGVPVVCTLQGEDGFVGLMPEPFKSEARRLMALNSKSIDLFISPGESYAEQMSEFLSVPVEKIRVVRAGIDTAAYKNPDPRPRNPFTIGYLSVITPAKGLDLLVDAFTGLTDREARLIVAGKVLDRGYWDAITAKIAAAGLSSRFEYLGEVDFEGKTRLLRRCSAFSVPSRIAESRAMAMMEAAASGVPIAAPETGVFPEMISLTGGGLLFPPGHSDGLARALSELLNDPGRADSIGQSGAAGIERHYSSTQMTEQTIGAYSELL